VSLITGDSKAVSAAVLLASAGLLAVIAVLAFVTNEGDIEARTLLGLLAAALAGFVATFLLPPPR
jgi:hypothetical protein